MLTNVNDPSNFLRLKIWSVSNSNTKSDERKFKGNTSVREDPIVI